MKKILYLLLFLVVEIYLFQSYLGHDATFHWFTHFYVGASIALIGGSIWQFSTHRSMRNPLLWVVLAHIFAMIPDLLYQFEDVAHRPWMDIFFGHIWVHFVPGRNWTWYAVFMATLAIYLYSSTKVDQVKKN